MIINNSPHDLCCIDLEMEAIARFRSLVPFLPKQCRVFRVLEKECPILCLDFTDCPAELPSNLNDFAFLLALSSHYLGLADILMFKVNDEIVARTTRSEFEAN